MINKNYLKKENIVEIKRELSKNGILVLKDFLLLGEYNKLKSKILKLEYKKEGRLMECNLGSAEAYLPYEINTFLTHIFGLSVKEVKAYSLGHKDYWLLSHEKNNAEFIFDFTPYWNSEFGGLVCYRDDKGNVIKIPSCENSLILVNDKKLKRYIQYVNHHAGKKKRYFILGKIC